MASTRIANPPLKIDGVHFYPQENGKNHKTSKFQLVERGTPVLRRGQSFFFALKTPDRRYDERIDVVRISFTFGPSPTTVQGTQHVLTLTKGGFPKETSAWACRLVGHDKNAISVEVNNSQINK